MQLHIFLFVLRGWQFYELLCVDSLSFYKANGVWCEAPHTGVNIMVSTGFLVQQAEQCPTLLVQMGVCGALVVM